MRDTNDKHNFFNKLHHDLYVGHTVVHDLDGNKYHVAGPVEHNHDDYGLPKYHHDCSACRAEHGPDYAPPHPRAAIRGDLLDLTDEDLLD